jgi:hypothetical protein
VCSSDLDLVVAIAPVKVTYSMVLLKKYRREHLTFI